MTIYWAAAVAVMLHGQPYGLCTMFAPGGAILATAKAFPSVSDRDVGIAHFDVEAGMAGKVRIECDTSK